MVEVYNQTAGPVDATGYVLQDEDVQLDYTVPQLGGVDIVLQPGGRIVLSIGGYYPDFQAGTTFYLFTGGVNPDGTLPNWLGGPGDADPADQVVLHDRSMGVADYVGWSGTPTPSVDFLGDDSEAVTARVWQDDAYRTTAALSVGQALARAAAGVDTNVPGDWSVVPDSTCDAMIAAHAVTRATIRGLRVDPAGVVEFATGGPQHGEMLAEEFACQNFRRDVVILVQRADAGAALMRAEAPGEDAPEIVGCGPRHHVVECWEGRDAALEGRIVAAAMIDFADHFQFDPAHPAAGPDGRYRSW